MAVVLAVTAGAVVLGVGAVADHAPDSGKRVSAESHSRTRSPAATPSPTASHRTSTPTPHPTREPTRKRRPPHPRGKAHRHPAFAGISHVLLRNAGTHLCADLPNFGKGSPNGPVNQYPCTMGAADNQVWSLAATPGLKGPHGTRPFQIRNAKDELCMDLPDYGAQPAGAKVSEYPCDPTTKDNQLWYLSPAKGGGHRIHNLAGHGLCLGVTGRATAGENARLEIQTCGHGDIWSWIRG